MQLLPYENSLNHCILPSKPNAYQVNSISPSALSYVVTYIDSISLPKHETSFLKTYFNPINTY